MIVKGKKVNNRYEIQKIIGEGGMANVYLAYDIILNRNVAVKVLRGDLSSDDKFVRRFQREALSASSLSHPNIVEIYDVGEDDGDYYIVMEYIPGKNLKELVKKRGNLTSTEVVDIMMQITSAMSVAHDSLIIHRDLKPQNILIMNDGGIKITDFGIAMAINGTHLTQTNSAMGSVHYFPPEQANGKGATLKSDVYSLGIVMYELLTGSLPYKGENAVEIALKHMKEEMPHIRNAFPELPQSIENIILKATAKNPKNRYSNAREMHDDLKTALNKEREEEPKIKFKYSEGLSESDIVVKKGSNIDDSIVKQINEPDEKTNKKIIILGSIFSALVLLALIIFLIFPVLTSTEEVKIPDVSNMTVVEAEKALEDLNLIVNNETEEISSEDIEIGKVVKTSPTIGRTIKEGSTITLYISTGIQKYLVEDFTGENYIEIKTKLEIYDIKVTIEERTIADKTKEYDDQEIIGQSVDPNTELIAGDKITLYIPSKEIYYPNVMEEGYTVEEVQSWADENDVRLTIVYQETTEYEPGTILSQSREPETIVVSGASFQITVSKEREEALEEIIEDPTEE